MLGKATGNFNVPQLIFVTTTGADKIEFEILELIGNGGCDE